MYFMFIRTTILYFGLIVFWFFLFQPFNFMVQMNGGKPFFLNIHSLPFVLYILIMIAWFILAAIIATIFAAKINNKIVEILTQKCDPYEFIIRYEKILKKPIGNMRTWVLLNLSSGYLTIGDLQKTIQIFDSNLEFKNNRAGILNKFIYFNNACAYCLQGYDIANAEIMLENMLESLKHEKFPKQQYDHYYNFYIEKQYAINVSKGNYTGAEEVFSIQFNREKTQLGKVAAKYNLGRVYLHLNNLEAAVVAFEYVVSNGNKTFYVGKSLEFLDQCKSNEPI